MIEYKNLELNKKYYYILNNQKVEEVVPFKKIEEVVPSGYCHYISTAFHKINGDKIPEQCFYETKKEATEELIEILKKDYEKP